jgi:hypothetical protein
MRLILILISILFISCEDEIIDCRPVIREGGCCSYYTPEVVDLDMDLVCQPEGCNCDTTLTFGEYYTLYPPY